MKIANIKIHNLLGITDAEITPEGNFIEVTGGNGVGKTSTIESVKAALNISEHKSLLRNGEESGEVVLDLGDLMVRRRYTEKGDKLEVKGKVFGTDKMTSLGSPASVLKGLVNPASVDPVRLLTAKPKELLDAVLNALPMNVTEQQMYDIFGDPDADITQVDLNDHALVVIAQMQKLVTEKRRDVNRDVTTGKTTIEQLEATLPEGGTDAEEIQGEIDEVQSKLETINGKARRAKRSASGKFSEKIEDAETEVNEIKNQIAQLQSDLVSAEALVEKLEDQQQAAADAAEAEVLAEGRTLQETLKRLNENARSASAAVQTVNHINQHKQKVRDAQKQSNAFTDQLDALQALKTDLCSDLPIEGLAVTDGKLSMNDVPFAQLNTAARIDLVIELAKLSAGDLGLVVLDNSEMLSDDTYAEFRKKAGETDLTFLVARVTEGDRKVEG